MRDFIDRARDYLEQGLLEDVRAEVESVLDYYHRLRARLSITDEDTENIETLLSMADLDDLVSQTNEAPDPAADLPTHLRRFIEVIVSRSVRLPKPDSPDWIHSDRGGAHQYVTLVRGLAWAPERTTVITLNYDCVIEYVCHCLGLPYSYGRTLGGGLEILKLHGSTNWVRCPNPNCQSPPPVSVSPIEHHSMREDGDEGYLERTVSRCDSCGTVLVPLIVPPTWSKSVDHHVLRDAWRHAYQALSEAEALVGIGYSMPLTDVHVRQLLHLGLASGDLRQALVIVGSDEAAAERWRSIFRESWRTARLEVRLTTLRDAVFRAVLPALVVPPHFDGREDLGLLPVTSDCRQGGKVESELRAAMADRGLDPSAGVNWRAVASGLRRHEEPASENQGKCQSILRELDLAWVPSDPALPTHGTVMSTADVAADEA